MAVLELVGSKEGDRSDASVAPAEPKAPVEAPRNASGGGSGGLHSLQAEIDAYYDRLTTLTELELGEIFQELSSISARVSQIRSQIIRGEGRAATALRTKHIDPLLEEIDRQFKFHSRHHSVQQMDWDMSKGQS